MSVELQERPRPRSVPLHVHGEMGRMFEWLPSVPGGRPKKKAPSEVLVEGPAGSGKTHVLLRWCLEYALAYPGSKIVFLRLEKTRLNETMLVEWEEEILGLDHPALQGASRENRQKYEIGNGSEVLLRGYDDDGGKLYSGQYHVILFNEVTDLEDEARFTRLHRAKRAKLVADHQPRILIADCNPREKEFWVNVRADTAAMTRIRTRLQDNPRWFDHEKLAAGALASECWTVDGIDYISSLSRGTFGPIRESLLLGRWVHLHGALFPEWDSDVHVVKQPVTQRGGRWFVGEVEMRWCIASMDAGSAAPGVFQVWGVDACNRMWRIFEVYRAGLTHVDWAEIIRDAVKKYRIQGMVCDHDKALIMGVNRELVASGQGQLARNADKTLGMGGFKAKRARIERFRSRLVKREMFFVDGVNSHVDEELKARNRPWKTEMEIPGLTYKPFVYGEDQSASQDMMDGRKPDHGFDAASYGEVFVFGRDATPGNRPKPVVPGSAADIFGPSPLEALR